MNKEKIEILEATTATIGIAAFFIGIVIMAWALRQMS